MKNLDWSSLGFGYLKTDYNVRCYYRDGKWGELEVSSVCTMVRRLSRVSRLTVARMVRYVSSVSRRMLSV